MKEEEKEELKRYRIFNKKLKAWWEGKAHTPGEACKKAGWAPEDCWVREYTKRGGWKNAKEA